MSDYYDAHPIRVPRIPISITGFFGSAHDRAGTAVAILTGLPLHDLPRLVEHRTGRSVARLVHSEGEPAYQSIETELLRDALRSSPPGVIVLGPSSLVDPAIRDLVQRTSALVHVHHDLELLAGRIERDIESSPGRFWPWVAAPGPASGDLERLYAERAPGYDEAMLSVDGTHRDAQDVAREIIERFALWTEEGPGGDEPAGD